MATLKITDLKAGLGVNIKGRDCVIITAEHVIAFLRMRHCHCSVVGELRSRTGLTFFGSDDNNTV